MALLKDTACKLIFVINFLRLIHCLQSLDTNFPVPAKTCFLFNPTCARTRIIVSDSMSMQEKGSDNLSPEKFIDSIHGYEESLENFEKAVRLYKEMSKDGISRVKPGVEFYSTFLNLCAVAHNGKYALELLNDMHYLGLIPDEKCFTSSLRACRRAGLVEDTLMLLERMRKSDTKPGTFQYNTGLRALKEVGRWQDAQMLLRKMKEEDNVMPNEHCYNTVMQTCDRAQKPQEAYDILCLMVEEGVEPNVFSYNAVMRAYERIGNWKRVLSLYKEMNVKGIKADWHSNICYLSACRRGRLWQKSVSIIQGMREEGIYPGMRAYNVAMQTCVYNKQWQRVLALGSMMIQDLEQMNAIKLNNTKQEESDGKVETFLGKKRSALETFIHELPQSNYVMDTLLYACQQDNAPDHARVISAKLKSLGIELSTSTQEKFSKLLSSKTGPPDILSEFDYALRSGAKPNEAGYVLALRECREVGDSKRAVRYVDEAESNGIELKDISYAAALSSCSQKSSSWQDGILILKKMRQRHVPLTRQSYSSAIFCCWHGKQWALAVELLEEMKSNGFTPSTAIYTKGITAFANLNQWSNALSLLSEMKMHKVSRTEGSYNAAIHACAVTGEWEDAVKLLDVMVEDDIKPSLISFNTAIAACGNGGAWEKALQLLEMIKRQGIQPDAYTYSAAITALNRSKRWREALVLMDLMKREGIKPNEVTYGAAIHACASGGLLTKAQNLMLEMKEAGMEPNLYTYSAMIHVCATVASAASRKRGKKGDIPPWKLALNLLKELETSGLTPDRVLMNSVMAACAAAARWQEALRVLKRMDISGGKISPDIVSFNTALSACSRAGAWDAASRVLESIENAGLKPTLVTYNTRMAQCQRSGHFSDALILMEEMRTAGIQPDAVTYTSLLWTVAQAPAHTHPRPGPRQWERCVSIVDDMHARGIPRTIHVYTAAMIACKEAFAYKSLLRLDEDRMADGIQADDTLKELVNWASEQQADEYNRLYP